MPESENKSKKVIFWQDTMQSRDWRRKNKQIHDYLTPQEVERAGEEGWSRIIAELGWMRN